MGAEEYQWRSRLCVMFKPSDGSSTLVSPINSMEATDDAPVGIIDSIDGCNLGYSFENPRYTFNMEVQALNMSVHRQILSAAMRRDKFSITWATLTGQPDDWVLDSIVFSDCVVTNTVQSISSDNKVPIIKFQCSCLGKSISNNGEVITTDKVGNASGSLS